MPAGFKIAEAYVEIVADRDKLNRDIADLPRTTDVDGTGRRMGTRLGDGVDESFGGSLRGKVSKTTDREGRGLGDKLSTGMRMSIIRNSPLIAAAVGGALIAGAPVMLAAATTLFAGVGVVAAAQADEVQSAWLAAWHEIRDGSIEDAQVLVPVLVGAADQIAQGFQSMRGMVRIAYAESADAVDIFTGSVVRASENALPGMVRAIQRSEPTIKGLGDFLESIGTGLSDFFTRLSEHSAASGEVFTQLGTTMEKLLPILAELLGQGAELATMVLPLLNSSLGLILNTLSALGPALPPIIGAFAGFRILQTVGGWAEGLGARLTKLGTKDIPLVSTAATKLGTGLSSAGAAAAAGGPVVAALAVTLGLLMAAHQQSEERVRRWTAAILEGGDAARTATTEMDKQDAAVKRATSGFMGFVQQLFPAGQALNEMSKESDKAKQAADDYLASLSPLQRAQHEVEVAQNDLNDKVDKYGPHSRQAADAASNLADKQRHAAEVAKQQEIALRGVTEAMNEMVNQARSLVDAEFAYEDATKKVAEATQAYADAVKEHGANSKEAADALDELERKYRDAGAAAAKLAESGLPAAVDDQTRAYFGARQELAYYHSLLEQGIDLPPELDTYVALLERQAGGAVSAAAAQDVLRAAIEETGAAVREVPGEKAVVIKGEGTEELRQRLSDLGFDIEALPDGEYKITADDQQSEDALTRLMTALADLNVTTANPKVELGGTEKFYTDIANSEAAILGLDGAKAEPDAELNSDVIPKTQTDFGWLDNLDSFLAKPQAELDTTVTPQAQDDVRALDNLHGQRPTPVASLDGGPFNNGYGLIMGNIGTLGAQTPTPTANLNSGPFVGVMNSVYGWLGQMNASGATPTLTAVAYTASAEAAINYAARPRKVLLQTQAALAGGGPIGGRAMRRFDIGGMPSRSSDGRISGPGGPLDDLIPAMTNLGEMIRVANGEWVINGRVSRQQGEGRMAALNAGLADIVPRQRPGAGSPVPVTGTVPAAGPVHRGDRGPVHIHLNGVWDFTKRDEARRLAREIKRAMDDLDREGS